MMYKQIFAINLFIIPIAALLIFVLWISATELYQFIVNGILAAAAIIYMAFLITREIKNSYKITNSTCAQCNGGFPDSYGVFDFCSSNCIYAYLDDMLPSQSQSTSCDEPDW